MTSLNDIGFVFTNYNNSGYTREAVRSIRADESHCRSHVVIVDNASNASNVRELQCMESEIPGINIVYSSSNDGYFRGLNCGIRSLKAFAPHVEHVVVGNNDLVFPKGFRDSVISCADIFRYAPVVSPDLVTLDGVHQNPHVRDRVGVVRETIWDLYYSNYTIAKFILWIAGRTRAMTERQDFKSYMEAGPIEQGYGACYILGPLFFEHFGLLWAPTFLMGEEYFLTKQLRDKGYSVLYEPRIRVLHHDHASIGKVPSERLWRYGREAHRLYRQCEREERRSTWHQ